MAEWTKEMFIAFLKGNGATQEYAEELADKFDWEAEKTAEMESE